MEGTLAQMALLFSLFLYNFLANDLSHCVTLKSVN